MPRSPAAAGSASQQSRAFPSLPATLARPRSQPRQESGTTRRPRRRTRLRLRLPTLSSSFTEIRIDRQLHLDTLPLRGDDTRRPVFQAFRRIALGLAVVVAASAILLLSDLQHRERAVRVK